MSLASIKAKEKKGKHKVLPKLKTILADPITKRCPTLTTSDLNELGEILASTIEVSNLSPLEFIRFAHVCLGLESSLRAINNCKAACVFLSLNIRPRHVIRLIARNVEVKDKTVPVFVQPNFENFTRHLFKVSAVAFVLPKSTPELGNELNAWIKKHQSLLTKNTINVKPAELKINVQKSKIKQSKACVNLKHKKISESDEKTQITVTTPQDKTKKLEGDFISFSNANKVMDEFDSDDDKDALLHSLNNIILNAEKQIETKKECIAFPEETVKKNILVAKNQKTQKISKGTSFTKDFKDDNTTQMDIEMSSDSDDFLPKYETLTVHKIRPNPNKKTKKKRKKNKNKNKIIKK